MYFLLRNTGVLLRLNGSKICFKHFVEGKTISLSYFGSITAHTCMTLT